MSNYQTALTNFINVSVATPPTGLAAFNVNNVLYMTKEIPVSFTGPYEVFVSPAAVAAAMGSGSESFSAASNIFAQSPNILDGDGVLIIWPMGANDNISSVVLAASQDVFFGGVLFGGYDPADAEITAAAATVQGMGASGPLLFAPRYNVTAVQGGGVLANIQAASQTKTRGLLYTPGALPSRLMAAAYAGRGMSVDFTGSNTTITMQLKNLVNVLPDPGISQTILGQCETAGADVYIATAQNLSKVISTGGNDFFDNQDNLLWLVCALQVAGFNAIATTSTKVPQTEQGMNTLKNALILVLEQAVVNGFIAPGAWNSSEVFGSPVDMRRNILTTGYYIYSQPVNQQSQANRATRVAPTIQIAIKFAGAVQSVNIIVNFNA